MNRTFLAIAVILMAVVVATLPSFIVLYGYWIDTQAIGMTHGWLIAAIVLWLFWRDRNAFVAGSPMALAFVGLVAAWVVWIVALRAGLQIVHLALVPPIAGLALLASLGRRVATRAMYPLAFFYFAIPLWGSINAPLQWLTVYAARFMLRATGIPAYFDGTFVHLPVGVFEIAGGCSGLHYFIVAIAIASLYAHIHSDPPRRHLAIVAVAAVAALILNWIRVCVVIVAGYLTDMQHYLVRVDHYYFGWVLYGVAMAVGLWLASRLLPPAPETPHRVEVVSPLGMRASMATLATVAILLGLFAVERVSGRPVVRVGTTSLADALIESGATPIGPDAAPWRPRFEGASDTFLGRLDGDGPFVFVALYPRQEQGAELGYYSNSSLGRTLRPVDAATVDLGDGVGSVARVEANDGSDNPWRVLTVYRVGERTFSSPDWAQVYYALLSLQGPAPSAAIAVAAECGVDCEATDRALGSAMQRTRAAAATVMATTE